MHLVDDRAEHFLLLHETVVHSLLLDEPVDGAVLPLGVVRGAKGVHFRAHVLFHLNLLAHAIGDRLDPLIAVIPELRHDVAIRLNNFDELIRGNLDDIGGLADNLHACLIILRLKNGLLGADNHHLTDVAYVYHIDIFLLILYHVLGVLRVCLHGLLEDLLDVHVLEVRLVLVDPT